MATAEYQNYTYKSPFFLKRWLHVKRFDDAIKVLNLKPGETFLDYGCGDGFLLQLLADKTSQISLYGFEPAEQFYKEAQQKVDSTGVIIVKNVTDLPISSFTKISCLETCEHLLPEDLKILFGNIARLLDPKGEVIFSVPVEIGLPAAGKNVFRLSKKNLYDNLSWRNIFRTALGLPVERSVAKDLSGLSYIYSHIGFDYRKFEELLREYFHIEKVVGSPTSFLPRSLNNTLYYICRKKENPT